MTQGAAHALAELSGQIQSRQGFIRTLFNLLDENETRYAVLHSYERLPERLPSDLDMAIHPDDWSRLPRTLAALRALGYRPVQCFNYAVHGYYFVFTWAEDGAHGSIAIDFISQHREGSLILSSGEFLVRHRRRRGAFWIPGPAAEFPYLLGKKVLKGSVNAAQAERLAELVGELGRPEAEAIAARLFGRKHAAFAMECCARGVLAENLPELRRLLWRRVWLNEPLNPIRYQITETVRRLQRFLQPTGVFAAVLGPDGVGKSTAIAGLRQGVGFCFRSQALFHWRPQFLWGDRAAPVTEPHARASHSPLRSIIHLTAHFVDNCLGYCAKVQPARVRSSLIVFDRYFDDVLVDPKRYRYSGPAFFARLLSRLAPKPDLVLILGASERAILSRKAELAPQELRRQLAAYRALGKRCERARLVDAGQSPDAVAFDAAEIVLGYLESRFLRVHRRWLDSGMNLQALLEFLEASAAQGGRYRFRVLPSRHAPRWLIPVDNSRVARNGLDLYTPWRFHARVYKSVMRRAAAVSPALLTGQPIQVASRRLETLEELVQRITGEARPAFALSAGAPGNYQKLTVQAMRPDGQILGFAKIPMTPAAEDRVRREADVLIKLRCSPQLAGRVPGVLHAEWDGASLLFQEPLAGVTGPTEFGDVHTQFLDKLHRIDRHAENGSDLIHQARAEWNAVTAMDRSLRELGEQALEHSETLLGGASVPCALSHGDFAPWNTRVHNGRLVVFDWEMAEAAPIWWDMFHFQTQTSCLLKKSRNSVTIPPAQPMRRGAYLLYLMHTIVRILDEEGRRTQELPYRQRMLARELRLAGVTEEQEQCS